MGTMEELYGYEATKKRNITEGGEGIPHILSEDEAKILKENYGIDLPPGTEVILKSDGSMATKSSSDSGIFTLVGGAVFIIGIFLVIGNLSGAFPTFPFAGFITTMIGAALMNA